MNRSARLGLAGALARAFIGSRLTPLLVVGSILLGVVAIVILPREEEPQIKVPVFDLLVAMGECWRCRFKIQPIRGMVSASTSAVAARTTSV